MKSLLLALVLTLGGCSEPQVVIKGRVRAIGGISSHNVGKVHYTHQAVAFDHDNGDASAYFFCYSDKLNELRIGQHVQIVYGQSESCDDLELVTQIGGR